MIDRRLFAAALLLLSGCERTPTTAEPVDESNPLEQAARERGLVRSAAADPTGVFERRHDLGRDAMCIVPVAPDEWRFALVAGFGPGLSCRAKGRVERDGDQWRLDFAGTEDCSIPVDEEEDELRLPGVLPSQCSDLCPARASLAGLRLPRASWSAADARGLRMRNRDGSIVQPCAD